MSKIRKGDDVVVLSGRDKGKRGTVLQIIENNRILVDNVNVIKKHVKPNPNRGETGGIIEKEAPIQISNVALFNPNTTRPTESATSCLRMAARSECLNPTVKWRTYSQGISRDTHDTT